MGYGPIQEGARPCGGKVRDVIAPVVIASWFGDAMILAVVVFDGKAPTEGLVVGRASGRAGFVVAFSEWEEVAEFGSVEEEVGFDSFRLALVIDLCGTDQLMMDVEGGNRGVMPDLETAAGDIGSEHRLEDGEANAGFMAERGDPAIAGIELRFDFVFGAERVVAAVVIADAFAESAVGAGATEVLDPTVFVGRDTLGGELAADPFGLFEEDDAAMVTGGSEGGSDAAGAAAGDENFSAMRHGEWVGLGSRGVNRVLSIVGKGPISW